VEPHFRYVNHMCLRIHLHFFRDLVHLHIDEEIGLHACLQHVQKDTTETDRHTYT